ncbi:unnamed protein product [Orchesella dallaii]|uniref:F-box domain-containing protein n=1 Tax=Orchesella dallaii TaxID=48710 RepID=A0ABP1RSH5_9HEXA
MSEDMELAGIVEEEDDVKFLSPVTNPMLPPEIWDKIFCSLESRNDLCAVINTCGEWSELLTSKKLPLGLPIVLVNKNISLNTLLFYRQLNRKTKEVVDKQLQKYSAFPEEDFANHLCSCRRNTYSKLELLSRRYFFWQSSDTKRFLKTFRLKSRAKKHNPFVTRSITLKHTGSGIDHFRTLLDCSGHHVFHITFVPVYAPGNLTELLSLLHLLPNIRTLKVDGDLYLQSERDYLRATSFPTLSYLTALDFSCASVEDLAAIAYEDPLIIRLFRTYGKQLQTLICRGSLFHAENLRVDWFHTENLSNLLPNLKNLRIIGVTATSVALTELAQVNWPLEKLQLWDLGDNSAPVQMVTVLQLIQTFGNTLAQVHLHIHLKEGQYGSKPKTSLVAPLSHVKSLSTYRSIFSITNCWEYFETMFVNVEELTVFEPLGHRVASKCENFVLAKKCFETLPKLKLVTVTFSFRCNKEPILIKRYDIFRLQ